MKSKTSRRKFISVGSMAGAGVLAGISLPLPGEFRSFDYSFSSGAAVSLKPRYYRWHVNQGQEWIEANTGHASLEWTLPLSQTAIVLVDVWQRHYIKDPEERAEIIINSRLIPLLTAARKAGIRVIHAPSPEVAVTHKNWVKYQSREQVYPKADDWPPADFRSSSGQYSQFAMPAEPMEKVRQQMPPLTFHPKVLPLEGEPVVANGIELHEYLKRNKLLFLLYAGFNTNACIINRDYGTIRMRDRGYRIILVRDCTTGMESKDTQATLAQTNGAILFLEMFGCFTVTSDEIISGIKS